MNDRPLKWEVRKRLQEIERCLYWKGSVKRANLIDVFGISPQQASADFSFYKESLPKNVKFNGSLKRYEPTDQFEAFFVELTIADYFQWSEQGASVTEQITSPLRPLDTVIIKRIVNTIHQQKSIEIHYQSMSSPEPSVRRITPHTVVYDGYRYHVRGYCHLRCEFRDFVLGRILKAVNPGDASLQKVDDSSWHTLVMLRLSAHPDLTATQKSVIEQDYGMQQGELLLPVRQALLVYTLTQLRIDRLSEQRTPAEQQIVLLNKEVLHFLK